MLLKKNWCVGCSKQNNIIKLFFRAEGVLDDKNYIIDYNIFPNKSDYIINSHPDNIIFTSIGNIELEMIVQTEGIKIVKRLEKDINFKNMIIPILRNNLFNNNIHINFELDEQAYKMLN
jgi:hypothetical protein